MSNNVNSVFYAERYHPIQAGSIDGIDIHPHDNAVYRALLCSNASLYDPFGDPKVIGDPYCTLFVGRLSHFTTEETLRKAMSKYGRVKDLRLVRHVVTGASRGYAFVSFETEKEMRRAYKEAHRTYIDDSEILVDYNRQRLMPGWLPRRLGGGLGGKKESGQLRFGGRERPFRAPLKQIPYDELQKLGIPLPPGGRYMSRFQVPSPPRRKRSNSYDYDGSNGERSQSASSRGQERSSSSLDLSHSQHRSRKRHGKDSRNRDLSEDEEPHREQLKQRASSRGDKSRSSKERRHEYHKRDKMHEKRQSGFEESSQDRDYRRRKRDSHRREHPERD